MPNYELSFILFFFAVSFWSRKSFIYSHNLVHSFIYLPSCFIFLNQHFDIIQFKTISLRKKRRRSSSGNSRRKTWKRLLIFAFDRAGKQFEKFALSRGKHIFKIQPEQLAEAHQKQKIQSCRTVCTNIHSLHCIYNVVCICSEIYFSDFSHFLFTLNKLVL